MMADSGDPKTQEKLIPRPISTQQQKGDAVDMCGVSIERKIESIESLASKVSNRRSRRWLNDRLLIELVPLLNAEEIRGLFAPPPWGDTARSSPFCMTNMGEWDSFRNIDMDAEASMIEAHNKSTKIKDQPLTDEMVAINAWHRVDRRTREALRRNFLSKLVENFEERIVTFIKESKDGDVLVLQVEDSFHRLLLHGVCEVKLCGHATLASAHFLFSSGLARGSKIEFITKSGLLTARKIGLKEGFSIELDFPVYTFVECDSTEKPSLPKTLNGASVINTKKISSGDLLVELSSGKAVVDLQPDFGEILKCAGRGLIVTGPASHESGFDFISRFFCPKMSINEDPVCGSAHCALVPYWSKKLGKHNLVAYQASPRGGILDLELKEDMGRVLMRGKAVTVMIGTLLV